MTMNWEAIGAIGEIVSALAVLATLIYLSVQIRAMRSASATDALRQIMETEIELNKLEIAHSKTILKGNTGEALTDEEYLELERIFQSHGTFAFHSFVRAKLEGYDVNIAARNFAGILTKNPVYLGFYKREDWVNHPKSNPREFGQLVNEHLSKAGGA